MPSRRITVPHRAASAAIAPALLAPLGVAAFGRPGVGVADGGAYAVGLIDSPPPREVRVVADAVHRVHGNLQLANVDFPEFAEAAAADPDGVVRDV
ncbi:hypothetical protein [Streptomyces sp. NPDC045714]|uniref:DUF6924 domain-containing protein n=1 Tax=Streptomyces sp. NPDC045714 TaxID=3154913 RepID=UPI0034084A82